MYKPLNHYGGCRNSLFFNKFFSLKYPSFTLSEVLITLVVIGIIAAITVPVLINNYRKQQYVTQLKKNYSIVSDAFRLAMVKDGVTDFTDTELYSVIGTYSSKGDNDYNKFKSGINQYFNTVEVYAPGDIADEFDDSLICGGKKNYQYLKTSHCNNNLAPVSGGYPAVVLADGSIIYPIISMLQTFTKYSDYTKVDKCGYVEIDVNGVKGPNVYGRDVFTFVITTSGVIFPRGMFLNDTWRQGITSCRPERYDYIDGQSCTARIMDEGWKMTY